MSTITERITELLAYALDGIEVKPTTKNGITMLDATEAREIADILTETLTNELQFKPERSMQSTTEIGPLSPGKHHIITDDPTLFTRYVTPWVAET